MSASFSKPPVVALALVLSLAQPAAAARAIPARTRTTTTTVRDTGRVVPGIVIGDDGVHIRGERSIGEPADDSRSSRSDSRDQDATVDVNVGRQRVNVHSNTVEVHDRGSNVRIAGPMVQVDGDDNDKVRVFS